MYSILATVTLALELNEVFGKICRDILTNVIEDTDEAIRKAFDNVDYNQDQTISREEAELAAQSLNRAPTPSSVDGVLF